VNVTIEDSKWFETWNKFNGTKSSTFLKVLSVLFYDRMFN